jgi:5-methylthioadenosine/S-adenosylhomocysteine deaminase
MAELGLRVWSCTRFHDVDFTRVHEGIWRHDPAIGEGCIVATLALMKQHHNGYGGRTHVTLAPHAPDTCSDELLGKVAALARDTGLNVWTHLSQSPLENEVIARRSGCTPTQLLERVGLLNDKLIAAHCIYLTDEDIARIAASGMTVAHVPKGNATGGAMAPTPKLKQAGARIALGTDNLTQDMTEAMRWSLAVARIQLGSVSDQWQPRDALTMATSRRAGARPRRRDGAARARLPCRLRGLRFPPSAPDAAAGSARNAGARRQRPRRGARFRRRPAGDRKRRADVGQCGAHPGRRATRRRGAVGAGGR